jgi:hypothetical protein
MRTVRRFVFRFTIMPGSRPNIRNTVRVETLSIAATSRTV